MVKALDRAFAEHFAQEHVAQRRRKLINQTRDPQVVVADNRLFPCRTPCRPPGDLRLLEAVRQILHTDNRCADANDNLCIELAAERVDN